MDGERGKLLLSVTLSSPALLAQWHTKLRHCAALGCPVLGDPVSGDGAGALPLLARSIALPLSPPIAATAPVPGHMHVYAGMWLQDPHTGPE